VSISQYLDSKTYKTLSDQLRVKLVNAQYDLKNSSTSVVLLLAGNDLPACEEFIDVLQEWVDVRYVDTRAFRWPTEEESQHPPLWRYWKEMPSDGRMAVFYGAWIMNLVLERAEKTLGLKEFRTRLRRINDLEKLLHDDGKIVLKIWLHTDEKQLKKRLKKAEKKPGSEMYVGQFSHHIYDVYKKSEPVIEELNSILNEHVPWQWIETSDAKALNVTIAQRLLAAMEKGVEGSSETQGLDVVATMATPKTTPITKPKIDYLSLVDLNCSYEYEEYKQRLSAGQLRLKKLFDKARRHKVTPVIAFEGWDAAGKGGVIRRLTQALSAWTYRVVPVAAPTPEELAYHYLWRFWRRIPRAGRAVIFDRTWYGRVLVERVEGYATSNQWQRAFSEINDFEAQLDEANCCVIKFWIHIDKNQQLERFKLREKTNYKKHKITDDDYRNREKWPEYEEAINQMVEQTSSVFAPWHLVPSNNKRYARVMVIEIICDTLETFIVKAKNNKKKIKAPKFRHL
jgi:polyphosphate:AMP phosphotransferase